MKLPTLLDIIREARTKRQAQVSAIARMLRPDEQGKIMSGRQALEWFRTAKVPGYPEGLGMRTQTFYQFWSPLKDMQQKAGKGVLLRPTDRPGAGTTTVTPFEQKRNYNYIVRIEGIDTDTGQRFERFITVADDELLPRESIEDAAQRIWATGVYEGLEAEEVDATYWRTSRRKKLI